MFQLICDGSCDLSPEQLRDASIETVPNYVSFDGETYLKEGIDISSREFFDKLAENPNVYPKTSMPTVGDFIDAFEPHLKRGEDILCYTLTSKFSGTITSARNAAEILRESYPERTIIVEDSTLITGLQGILMLELTRYKREGHTLEETFKRGEEIKKNSAIFFTLENVSYLSHGGRIGKVVDLAMAGVGMRPIIRFGSGEIFPVGVALGKNNAIAKVVQAVDRAIDDFRLDIKHFVYAYGWGYRREEAEPFFEKVTALFRSRFHSVPQFVPIQIGAAVGVHVGPHPIGIGFIERA